MNTSRGEILIREASPRDAVLFRELRLYAVLDTPTAFSADYKKSLNHPTQFCEDMLTMQADESTMF
jgi:hypothetical protein